MIKVGQIYYDTLLGRKLVVTWVRADKAFFYLIRNDGSFYVAEELESEFEFITEYPTWQEAVNSKEFKDES